MANWLSRTYAPVRRALPAPIANFIRSTVTAFGAPTLHYARSGHFRSAYARRAVDNGGRPLPWYSYPCIEFLAQRDFTGRTVLEFGGGQSTHWWASKASRVVTLEADPTWADELSKSVPSHVSVSHIAQKSGGACVDECEAAVRKQGLDKFDIIVIDGLDRNALCPLALRLIKPDGAIILDNAAGYGFADAFRGSGMMRVDFYGAAPGVITRHSTSLVFASGSFLFSAAWPIVGIT